MWIHTNIRKRKQKENVKWTESYYKVVKHLRKVTQYHKAETVLHENKHEMSIPILQDCNKDSDVSTSPSDIGSTWVV